MKGNAPQCVGDLAQIILGQSPPSEQVNSEGVGTPFLQGNAEFGHLHPVPKHWCVQPLKMARPNDVLLSVRAPVGAVNLAEQEYGIGRGVAAIRVSPPYGRLLLQYLNCFSSLWRSVSQGSTFEAISGDDIRKLSIPPIFRTDFQLEATLLDKVDAALELAHKVTEQTRRLRAAAAQDLLLHAVREKRFPVLQTRLGSLFTERSEKGRPGLPTMAITMNDGIMDREDMDRRIESALTPQEHLLAHAGDLAYNMMRMWQGVSGLVPHDSLISPAYVVVTPTAAIDAAFAAHLFKLPEMIRLFHRYSQGLTNDRLRLYYHQFAEIPVAIPKNKSDQQRIARLLTQLEQTAQAQETRLAQLQRTKTAISNQIFSNT